jgi:hypothetical protein
MINPGLRGRMLVRLSAAAALLTLGLLALSGTFAGRAASAPRAHAAAGGISFSHAVVVDHQRPGNEPDVKVDTGGTIYTSIPFGFSTTESFVWSSLDAGNSYQFVPGNIATTGKQATCFGGGDTDLFLDAKNSLYFSDLQGLTNISNSRSDDGGKTWQPTCAGAPNTPDDRMWFAGTGSFTGGNLNLYQDYDSVANSPNGGNVLVETISHDGASTFQPVVPTNPPDPTCGASIHDCVTSNEGISGNQVVDPGTGNVFIAHTTSEGSSGTPGVRVSEGKIIPGSPTMATWSESPNFTGLFCPASANTSDGSKSCTDSNGFPEELAGENFATIARDSAGYLYVTFTAGPLNHNFTCDALTCSSNDPNAGALTRPEQIYVVHSLEPATMADPSKVTWSVPQAITGSGASTGTNTFPWITAGSDGRVAVAWYHTNETSEQGTCPSGSGTCTLYGADSLSNAEWSVQMAQSLNAHDPSPGYTTANVSEAYVKHGQICTNGIGCATGGDRSLGDFLQITTDPQGAALVSYVFDTSQDTSAGEDSGPEVISRQISGPSLLASTGSVSQGSGPGIPMGAVGDPSGDAFYSANSTRTPGGDNLDLTGASLGNGANRTLIAKINVKSLASLTTNPAAAGGSDASWILRWTDVVPGTTGNGHIYYLGMDNNQGAGGSGTPSFFVGDTSAIPPPGNPQEHTKYITYPQTKKLSSSQASYNKATGVITFHIPLSFVGNPANGTVLYSGTAFSATSGSPQSSTTLFNLIDATTPFELVIGPPGTVGSSPGGPPPFSSSNSGSGACAAATGRLTGRGLGKLRLRMARATARRIYPRWSTRGRRYMEFYCLTPIGLRAGYPSNTFLRSLPGKLRRAVQGRVVLLLTANRHYALRGVRPGARLSRVRRRLKVGRAYHIGRNTWYLTPNGPSHGLVKVQGGVIREVGIVDKQLSSRGYRKTFRFLNSFRAYL